MDKVHFFKDDADEWRWHRKSENGEIVADSAEGYTDVAECRERAKQLFGDQVEYVNDYVGLEISDADD